MAATQCYVGARTPFGVIVEVNDRVYNAEATVEARDGSRGTHRLPFLIAHGARPAARVAA